MIGQLLEPVDLGCQTISVIIFPACHVDQIYTACVLFIRASCARRRHDVHAHEHVHTVRMYLADSSGPVWAAGE